MIRRALWLLALLLLLSAAAYGQAGYTQVTAVVKDSNGAVYANAPYNVSFFDPGTSGKLPLLDGSKFQQSYTGVNTDSLGNLAIALPDNNEIASSSGATGTQWIFTFSDSSNSCHGRLQITISGASEDLTAAITAVLPVLSTCQPGVAISVKVNGASISNPNFVNTPTVTYTTPGAGQIQATATGGGGGGGSSVTINSVGVAAPNFKNNSNIGWSLSGSDVVATPVAAGSEGSIAVNHSNAFAAVTNFGLDSGISPTKFINGYILFQQADARFSGSNPWIDITAPPYNARAINPSNSYTTTGSITSGQTSLTIAAQPVNGLNNLDGISVNGAGPATSQGTPTGLTVTPVEPNAPTGYPGFTVPAPTGATTFQYQVAGMDQGCGLSTPTTAVSISTGNALGTQPVTISTWTRSGTTVSVVTASAHNLAVGAEFEIIGSTDTSVNGGPYKVVTTTDNTHLTFTGSLNTVDPEVSTSGSGGMLQWRQGNELAWTAGTGSPFQHVIWGRTAGSMTLLHVTLPGTTVWDDYGSTMENNLGFPACIPMTPPAGATAQQLTTTITAGGGTTSLTLAAAASNTVSGATVSFDDQPAIVAAYAAANSSAGAGAGKLRFPAPNITNGQYVTNSVVDLSTLSGSIAYDQGGPILANMPWKFGGSTTFRGRADMVNSFGASAWSPEVAFNCGTASPCWYLTNSNGFDAEDFSLNSSFNSAVLVNAGGTGGFNSTYRMGQFNSGTGSTDYMGMVYVSNAATQVHFDSIVINGSNTGTSFQTTTPFGYFVNNLANTVGAGSWFGERVYVNGRRGFAVNSSPAVSAQVEYSCLQCYRQGGIQPFFTTASPRAELFSMDTYSEDTNASSAPTVANLNNSGGGSTKTLKIKNVSGPQGGVGFSTGLPWASYIIEQSSLTGIFGGSGQTTNKRTTCVGLLNPPAPYNTNNQTYGCDEQDETLLFRQQHAAIWPLPPPGSVTCTIGNGGANARPVGTYNYLVTAVGFDGGGDGEIGHANTCSTTTGNQQVNLTWTAVQGAKCYNVYINGGANSVGGLCVTGTSFSDSAAGNGASGPGTFPGSGRTTVTRDGGLFASQLCLSSPLSGGAVSFSDCITPGTLTANRTPTLPDSNGQLCVTGLVGCDFFADTGTPNTYAFCPSPAVTAYVTGQLFSFQAGNSSTGPSTANVCSLGAKTIKKNGGTGISVGSDIATGDIKAGQVVDIRYDGTNFQIQSQLGNAGGGGGTVSTTGSPANGNLTKFSSATTITNADLTGDVTTAGTSATTVAKIQTIPVNTASVQPGQILNVAAGPQYINQYPGVNYNAQPGNYTIACPGDRLGYVDFTGSSASTFTLPQSGSTACLGSSATYIVANHGSALLTLAATSSTIDGTPGATGVAILPNAARFIYSDNVNYHTTLVQQGFGGVNIQTTNYTAVPSDDAKLVVMNCSSACVLTLPNPPPKSGEFSGTEWNTSVMTIGAANATISLNTLTFNTSSAIPVLIQYQAMQFFTDGSNYFGSVPFVPSTNITFTPATNGVSISASGGGGGGPALQTNGVSNTSQATLNFQNTTGAATAAQNITWTNPSGGNEQAKIANVQGTDTALATAATVSTTPGTAVCSDANGGVTTAGCNSTAASVVCTPGSFVAQTDAATVTWAIASNICANASLTFTVHSGSRTLNITNPVNGGSYVIWLKQDATGGEGLTLGTGCTWKVINGGSGAVTLSNTANAIDVLAFTFDGTNCYANLGKNYN